MSADETPRADDRHGPRTSEEHRAAGHWLLAKLGKKVLRPGGIELTRRLLRQVAVGSTDRVVELGPGLGRTAQLLLEHPYATYTGIEPNDEAREQLSGVLTGHHDAKSKPGVATDTGLDAESADVVVSEAMLTMQSDADKTRIAEEVFRVLAPGGRWAIHEMNLAPDDLDESISDEIRKTLSRTIKVGARPLTAGEWRRIVTGVGFEVSWVGHNDMKLVDPTRVIADEGLLGALKFFGNVRRNKDARTRVRSMRAVFHKYREHVKAIALVVRKPEE